MNRHGNEELYLSESVLINLGLLPLSHWHGNTIFDEIFFIGYIIQWQNFRQNDIPVAV